MSEQAVRITTDGVVLDADLSIPSRARGIVAFAHGSGSSRHSARNRMVATSLQADGLATLLLDLLTPEEEEAERVTRHLRFDVELLGRRMTDAVGWLGADPATEALPTGLFGASTGAAAALIAAARDPGAVGAVVSRGGRPDLARDVIPAVRAPSLLIVGGADTAVLEMNRDVLAAFTVEASLEIVAGATHLFEEPGALEAVARLAGDWFLRHLPV